MDIKLGYLIKDGKARNLVTLPWDNIGILVVGRPGSGKSHVIASMLTQYVIKGAEVIVAEYNADDSNPQSLLYRIKHIPLRMPAMTTGLEIIELIKWIKQELSDRQSGKAERTPLVIVIDEFFQFAASVKPPEANTTWKEGDARSDEGERKITQKDPTFWEILLSAQTDLRKNNIRLILAAQETSSTATSNLMRSVRDMFRFKLIMNLSPKGSDLLGITDRESQRIIDKLKPGRIFYNGSIIGVPYPINPQWIEYCQNMPQKQQTKIITPVITYDWTPEDVDLYLNALFAQWNKYEILSINGNEIPSRIDTKEDLIRMLVLVGKNNEFITSHVKGKDETIRALIKQYREQYGK